MTSLPSVWRTALGLAVLAVLAWGSGVVKFTPVDQTIQTFLPPTSQITTAFEHQQVHLGHHFTVSNFQAVSGAATNQDYLITTGAIQPHVVWLWSSTSEFQVRVYEGPTVTDPGTALLEVNNRRSSATVATTVVTLNPVTSATGTEIWVDVIGSGGGTPGQSRAEEEFLLVPSTQYLLRGTKSTSGSDELVMRLVWYEPQ